ncbi:MAG: cytidylate kinase family protein [bacterium]|nr:cytidylate kinase family protein [bacterium]
MRITISGTPGSGKSTAARTLARQLGYARVNGGDIYRAEAKRRGMTVNEFGAWLKEHPEWDEQLDAQLMHEGAARDNVILEGRLTGLMTKRDGIAALRVWMSASQDTRIGRLASRDGGTSEEVRKRLREREESERERYLRTYGLDLSDMSAYDLVVETDARSPDEIVSLIIAAMQQHGAS